ncbi:hypothetical protein AVEN_147211-1 [Araneus ventricosus]|uniref:Uncharacterized protein n=1 Tax=Araneus ventricosus TaxID=182803 RepID=A0A4Y2GUQ2_ARAVE|nr:hypothetical protein AVEN_98345-1 [Araneus ventricosus]GBM56515.1 hypothetical protein AVEN_92744-1 [Araneus ventricosus]GBM56536.1 hypothetical protein AVEN_124296-1 [Araneus ventricosus]GBM56545.1 hypothetical protein AVEN_147211-1 [Araneus ventricosus]
MWTQKIPIQIYVADITEPSILALDFLQRFNFTVDLEKNEMKNRRRGQSFVFSKCTACKIVICIGQGENCNTSNIVMSYPGSSRSFWTIQIYQCGLSSK